MLDIIAPFYLPYVLEEEMITSDREKILNHSPTRSIVWDFYHINADKHPCSNKHPAPFLKIVFFFILICSSSRSKFYPLTFKALITTAADDIHKYFFIVFQRK